MNNSLYSDVEEVQEVQRTNEGDLVKVIEAIGRIIQSPDWSTLKTHVFDDVERSIERRMAQEAKKRPLNESTLYFLQGQHLWAKRYADLDKLADTFRLELTNLRKQLNPPTERDYGS